MPWRLIGFVIFFGIFLAFIAFNLDNSCDISFGFKTISAAPVYLTVFVSFALGILCVIPFAVSLRFKQKAKAAQKDGFSPAKTKKKRGDPRKDEDETLTELSAPETE
jgi:hypothetical protein